MGLFLHRSGFIGGGGVGAAAGGGGSGDPNFANVELLMHMDGTDGSTTFTDSSSNARTLTALGNAQIDTAQSKFGGASGLFDGSGDAVDVGYDEIFHLVSGTAFTLETWIRFNGTPASCAIMGKPGVSSNRAWTWQFTTTGGMSFLWAVTNSSLSTVSRAWSPSGDTWYHVAVCKEASNDLRMFVDGTQLGATESGVGMGNANTNKLYIGAQSGASDAVNVPLNGWLDDVRITIGTARYTSSFTPPTSAFPDS